MCFCLNLIYFNECWKYTARWLQLFPSHAGSLRNVVIVKRHLLLNWNLCSHVH